MKYTAQGGQVTLALQEADNQAVIEISDSGIGIDARDLPHIFERFYRADRARSRETRGSGLGLSIAKWIAEVHSGSISVRTEYTRGSIFTVRLPMPIAAAGLPEPNSNFGVINTFVNKNVNSDKFFADNTGSGLPSQVQVYEPR